MKNLIFILFLFCFTFFYKTNIGQIVSPTNAVCPGDTVEYIIDSSITGEQEFGVENGKFIVADSLYITPPGAQSDSIFIALNTDSIKKFKVKWETVSPGKIFWYQINEYPESQEIEIYEANFGRLIDADSIVSTGIQRFNISIRQYDVTKSNKIITYSNNKLLLINT